MKDDRKQITLRVKKETYDKIIAQRDFFNEVAETNDFTINDIVNDCLEEYLDENLNANITDIFGEKTFWEKAKDWFRFIWFKNRDILETENNEDGK